MRLKWDRKQKGIFCFVYFFRLTQRLYFAEKLIDRFESCADLKIFEKTLMVIYDALMLIECIYVTHKCYNM